jgi:DNA/RNA endonuclease G (NUC1)
MRRLRRILAGLWCWPYLALAVDATLEPYLPVDTGVVRHEYYDLSYNVEGRNPRWTVYRLEESNLVDAAKRRGEAFRKDPMVPGSPSKSRFKGYDAGHMVPADDMEFDRLALKETFYTTNACPQTARLNRGNWKTLENRCRTLAKQGKTLIVVSGPVSATAVAPDRFFKVLYDMDSGTVECWLSDEEGNRETDLAGLSKLTGIQFRWPISSKSSPASTVPGR